MTRDIPKKLRWFLARIVLLWIMALAVLAVIGAFRGATRARELFNSFPMQIFWLVFTLLLTVGMLVFARLRQKVGLLLIHAGCVLVLVGGMWGSDLGHQLQKQFWGIDKVPQGYMVVLEGKKADKIMSGDFRKELAQLPFSLRLHDFRLEYYHEQGKLLVYRQDKSGSQIDMIGKIPARPGEVLQLDQGLPSLKVLRQFHNFRITTENGSRTITDDAQAGENPALELELTWPDGNLQKSYVFERFPKFNQVGPLHFRYILMPKDYFSDLEVEVAGAPRTVRKMVEVNHPLHYGGYYFYQSDYDHQGGTYTVLSVTSDTGLGIVFGGYFLLCLGTFWHFWFSGIFKPRLQRINSD